MVDFKINVFKILIIEVRSGEDGCFRVSFGYFIVRLFLNGDFLDIFGLYGFWIYMGFLCK